MISTSNILHVGMWHDVKRHEKSDYAKNADPGGMPEIAIEEEIAKTDDGNLEGFSFDAR